MIESGFFGGKHNVNKYCDLFYNLLDGIYWMKTKHEVGNWDISIPIDHSFNGIWAKKLSRETFCRQCATFRSYSHLYPHWRAPHTDDCTSLETMVTYNLFLLFWKLSIPRTIIHNFMVKLSKVKMPWTGIIILKDCYQFSNICFVFFNLLISLLHCMISENSFCILHFPC